jgi:hypothetical protein
MEFIIHAQYATAGCSGHRIDTGSLTCSAFSVQSFL